MKKKYIMPIGHRKMTKEELFNKVTLRLEKYDKAN